jgi:nucleotide-binding universal stress UspA family protein
LFKNILIPSDGSTLSRKAIKAGIALAKSTGARVTGFYSPEPDEILAYREYFPADLMSRAEWDERSKKTARKFLEALSDPAVLGQFADMDVKAGGGTPEAFHAHIRAETRRWGDLVRARGIRLKN